MANALTMMPWVPQQFGDINLGPANGYQLFVYAAGTTTKQDTYTGASQATSPVQTNPIILNSAGMPASPIFLLPLNYKFVLAPPGDTDPPTSPIWTRDNVEGLPPFNVDVDISGTAGETIAVNDCVFLSDGSGGKSAGHWYLCDSDLALSSTTPRVVGFAMTSGGFTADITIRRMGRVTGMSGLTSGSVYYVSATGGAITATAPANARRVGQADSTTSLVIAAEIEEPVKGFIPIPLVGAREIAANVIPATAATPPGGILTSDTTPALERVNAATDKALRIKWVAANVDEITFDITYPPDLDDLSALEIHFMAAMSGATNAPAIAVSYFEGVGDANAGSNSSAVTGTAVAEYIVSISSGDIGPSPNFASISLVPAAHGTDALYLYRIWCEYTRKLLAT